MKKLKVSEEFKKDKKKALYLIPIALIALISLIFAPILSLILIIAIVSLGICVDYYKRKKTCFRKKAVCAFLILLSISNFFIFISFFMETTEKVSINNGQITYYQEGYTFNAETFLFDEPTDANGQIEPRTMIRYPMKTSIYHYLPLNDRFDNEFYTFHIKTNLKFKDYELTVRVFGVDHKEWDHQNQMIDEFDIIVDETLEEQVVWKYDSFDNITCAGDDGYTCYQFVFYAELATDQEIGFSMAYTWISINSTVSPEDEEWGITKREVTSLPVNLQSIFSLGGAFYILVLLATSIMTIFIIMFLLCWVMGALKKLQEFLLVITVIALLFLVVAMALSQEFFIIKETISFFDALPDPLGLIDGVIFLIQLVGMIVAFFLWDYTVGIALSLSWGLYYMFNRALGTFSTYFEQKKRSSFIGRFKR